MVALAPLWNLSRHDRTILLGASSRPAVTSGHAKNVVVMMNNVTYAFGHCFDQRPVITSVTTVARAMIGRIRSLRGSVQSSLSSPFFFLFFTILASGLVPIFVLGLCLISWVFSCASRLLLIVLIVGSSCRLRPSHVLHQLQNNHLQIY